MKSALRRRTARGTHVVEFALLMPLFLMLVMGCIEYSWVMVHRTAINSAVDVGCRAASLVDPGLRETNKAAVTGKAASEMVTWFDQHGPGCKGSCVSAVDLVGSLPGRSVRCRLQIDYTPITGFLPTPSIMAATAVVRLEYQRNPS
ncbi:MAG: pilus assembly protein [Myxococcota bacterium]